MEVHIRVMATLIDNKSERAKARHPEKQKRADSPVLRKPDWIRVKAPTSRGYAETRAIVRSKNLVTVCEEVAHSVTSQQENPFKAWILMSRDA